MGNRRKTVKQSRPDDHTGVKTRGLPHEVTAVLLACIGVLTILALASYDAADSSLNASGGVQVHNWIGPAGAYWSDLLLQSLGVGAYALGLGLLLAAWRALVGKRILPGPREILGTAALIIAAGALGDLLMQGTTRSYPAGGVAGALLSGWLLDEFATVGAHIIATALVLMSLALTADGILAGLGLRGLSAGYRLLTRMQAAYIARCERQRELRAARAVQQKEEEEATPASDWSFGELDVAPRLREQRREKIEQAKARGRAQAVAQIEREREAPPPKRDQRSDPQVTLDSTVDLVAEDQFELGDIPSMDAAPLERVETPADLLASAEDAIDDEAPDAPIAIREAALPAEAEAASATPKSPTQTTRTRRKRAAEPEIVDVRPDVDAAAIERTTTATENAPAQSFELPPVSLLDFEVTERPPINADALRENALRLTRTLKEYGIDGHVREIRPGPVVTMYEYVPAPGIKLSRIASLADDIAMSMEALRVRIVAPIPGKGAVGIEIPNEERETVYLKEIIAHDSFRKGKSKITLALGKDIEGNAVSVNLAKMPHLLVAGATGAGKSVSINAMIMSILFKATPEDVRLIMVDPKMLELSVYDGIPHLLLPVVTDPKKAALALRWAVEEMERRYQVLSDASVRSIDSYNQKVEAAEAQGGKLIVRKRNGDEEEEVHCERMPYIVVIVDELADLMMVASREVESSIMRLAQMARAAGIHLILATQRPSVDVITGVIKANFPTRIAFQVASRHDSRTIIDGNGAEHLLGRGDMLYLSPGVGGIMRVHGAFVSDEEIERSVQFLRKQGTPHYDESILAPRDEEGTASDSDDPEDEMYDQAIAIVSDSGHASISMIQRRLRIGYNRAARMVERMETDGIVGPADGAKPREVLVSAAPM